jgi:hypothetical protein
MLPMPSNNVVPTTSEREEEEVEVGVIEVLNGDASHSIEMRMQQRRWQHRNEDATEEVTA